MPIVYYVSMFSWTSKNKLSPTWRWQWWVLHCMVAAFSHSNATTNSFTLFFQAICLSDWPLYMPFKWNSTNSVQYYWRCFLISLGIWISYMFNINRHELYLIIHWTIIPLPLLGFQDIWYLTIYPLVLTFVYWLLIRFLKRHYNIHL